LNCKKQLEGRLEVLNAVIFHENLRHLIFKEKNSPLLELIFYFSHSSDLPPEVNCDFELSQVHSHFFIADLPLCQYILPQVQDQGPEFGHYYQGGGSFLESHFMQLLLEQMLFDLLKDESLYRKENGVLVPVYFLLVLLVLDCFLPLSALLKSGLSTSKGQWRGTV